jgi:hypothetical protein
MKNPTRNNFPSIAVPILIAAVQIDLFVKMMFMGRRKKIRYLTRTIFQSKGRLRSH